MTKFYTALGVPHGVANGGTLGVARIWGLGRLNLNKEQRLLRV